MRNHQAYATYMYDHLLSALSQNDTSVSPREIVHVPERIQGEEEGEGRNCQNVDYRIGKERCQHD